MYQNRRGVTIKRCVQAHLDTAKVSKLQGGTINSDIDENHRLPGRCGSRPETASELPKRNVLGPVLAVLRGGRSRAMFLQAPRRSENSHRIAQTDGSDDHFSRPVEKRL